MLIRNKTLRRVTAWLLAAILIGTSVNAGGLKTLAASEMESLRDSIAEHIATPSNAPAELLPGTGLEVPAAGMELPAAVSDLPVATADLQVATLSNFPPEFPAFEESCTVDGITVTVSAEEGAFPEGALLVVEKATEAQAEMAEAAVTEQREAGKNVALSYTFDIHVEDEEGNELKPEDGKSVRVSFSTAAAADANLEAGVYHIREAAPKKSSASGLRKLNAKAAGSISMTAEKLDVEIDETAETVSVETDGFSLYTVEFTYNDLQYVMTGGTEIPLSVILEAVGLQGEISAVEVSDETLFSAELKDGEWVILSYEPFSSEEWMKVRINDIVYEIVVTDATTVGTWAELRTALTSSGDITLGSNITISQAEIDSSAYLFVSNGVTVTLNLNGKTLTGGGSNATITVSSGGTLTIKDSSSAKNGKITGGDRAGNGGGIEVEYNGNFTLQSGTISGNTAYYGGGVHVHGGTFTMTGGTISANSSSYGGGVDVSASSSYNGTFTMSGGTISGNTTSAAGAGVRIGSDCSFTMTGGTISGNDAGNNAGGVLLGNGAEFNMSAGNITDNTAGSNGNGGGVYVGGSESVFTMSGGTISGNSVPGSAAWGGGVCNLETFTMSGGSIINNSCEGRGGGLYANGTNYLQGNIKISGNKNGSQNSNVYTMKRLIITGALTNTTPIGITGNKAPEYPSDEYADGLVVVFTDGLNGRGDASNFAADEDLHAVIIFNDENYTNEAAMSLQYTVTVTPVSNSHMTKTSGANPQTVTMERAISSIVYTADTGYHFPTNYASLGTTNGLTVARTSDTKITISGTPSYGSSAVNLSLAAASPISAIAPTITSQPVSLTLTYGYSSTPLTLSAGAISGHTLSYQWQSSTNGSSWSDISGATSQNYSIPTGYSVGIKYYRCRVTATRNDNSQTASTYSNSATVTISPRTAALTWSNTSLTYNRTSQKPTCTVSNLVNGDSCTVTVGGAQTNAGTYTATASSLSNSNYQLPTANTTGFTIAKKTVTLTWGTRTFTYNGNTQTPNATAGGVISGDTCTVTVTGGQKNAGTHTATASGLTGTGSGNYQLPSAKTTSFTIAPKTVTLTWGNTTFTYNGNTQTPTATAGGVLSGDTCAVTVTGGQKNAGTHTATASSLSNSNYQLPSARTTSFTIDPAPLTVTADAKSKTYGDTDPELTYTATGFQGTDTKESVMSGDLARDTGENTGDYAIRQGSVSAGNNYTISYTGANLTIGKATLTVRAVVKSKTYGDTDPALNYTATGFTNGDNLLVMSGKLERDPGENAGNYAIRQGTLSAGDNYTISYTGANFKIDPAPLTVTAEAKSKTYGDADPELTYSADGFKNGDTESVMSGDLAREAGENAGDYAISQGTVSAGDNYTISYTGADLTIDPATLTVTAEAKSKTYGDADPELTYTADGFKNGDTDSVMSGDLAREAGENAGDYAISQGTVSAGANYTISYTGADLTIDPAPLTVAAEAKSKTYGDADPELTYSADGFKNGDTVSVMSGDLAREAGENVGDYTISQGTVSAGINYTISYTGADLTIDPAPLTVTANAGSKTYGDTDPELTYDADGFKLTDTKETVMSGTLERAAGENVGDYAIGQGTVTAGSNYTISFTGADFKIDPKEAGLSWPDTSFIYDGTAHIPAAEATGLVSGDTCEVTVSGAGTDAGSYTASASALSNGNYKLPADVSVNFTVEAAAFSVTTPDAEKVYDGTALTAEGTVSGLVNGETATFVTTGSQTEVGGSTNSYSLTWDGTAKESNYLLQSESLGKLTVTEYADEITATTTGGTFVYDGKPHGATVEVSELPVGYTLVSAASSAAATDVTAGSDGTAAGIPATADTLVIQNASGTDVTDRLNITKADGSITITPAPYIVTTPDAEKVYDGTPLTAEGSISGLIGGETASLTAAGTQTEVGSSANTYSLIWDGTAKKSNYALESESLGTLTVTEYAGEITATTTGGTFTYDGKAHGATVEVSELPAGYTLVSAASSATATDVTAGSDGTAGSIPATADTLVIQNASGTDVTDRLNITKADGSITIEPAALTVTTPDAEKVYDGTALTAAGSISGLVNGETVTVEAAGSQKDAGSSSNTYSLVWNGTAKEANYKVTGETLGKLTVTPREVTISGITANNKTYDRSANIVLNYDSVVISGLVDGDSLTVSGTGTCDDAKVGKSKTVTISNLTLGGADAGNYKISSTGSQTTTTVDIEPARSGGGSTGSAHRKGYVGTVGGDWHQGGPNWTYTFGDGHSATGWNYLYYNGRSDWYYFAADSALMQTGWIDWEGNRYYLDPVSNGWKGSMFTGWHLIDGKWYYFETVAGKNQGRMYRNERTPDGFWVGEDGVWVP